MELLEAPPYGPRDDEAFVDAMLALHRHHLAGCAPYRALFGDWEEDRALDAYPYLHVGLFKSLELVTEGAGRRGRTLRSSGTSGSASRVVLDAESSARQARSSSAILRDFVGEEARPLLILDSARSLMSREMSARVAAALSLKPLSTQLSFLLASAADAASLDEAKLRGILAGADSFLVYGFTSFLWFAWAAREWEAETRALLATKRFAFVHSGGWKTLEAQSIGRAQLDARLLAGVAAGSCVVDYYGLVEQVGVVYPLCPEGFRHVPVWGAVRIRCPYTGRALREGRGQIQLLNTLPLGSPCHSVLTEDQGRIEPGPCPCGRSGTRFVLEGRLPRAERRGCADA